MLHFSPNFYNMFDFVINKLRWSWCCFVYKIQVRCKDNLDVMSVVLFDWHATYLLGKSENVMVKGFPEDGEEDAYPDELNVIAD